MMKKIYVCPIIIPDLLEFIKTRKEIRDNEIHHQLQENLVEHVWQHKPDLY
jgi:hypothetical protein